MGRSSESSSTFRTRVSRLSTATPAHSDPPAKATTRATRDACPPQLHSARAGCGIKDHARNVHSNQQLLRSTFQSALGLLAPRGEVHLTLKRGEPYDSWQAVTIAKMVGFRVQHCTPFNPELYPGYAHRRSIGDEHAGNAAQHVANAEIGDSKTYCFVNAAEAAAAAVAKKHKGGGSAPLPPQRERDGHSKKRR